MTKFLHIFVLLTLCAGCASKYASIKTQYESIHYDDGVTFDEAKTIAQHHLLSRTLEGWYRVLDPKPLENLKTIPDAEDFWFISFDEKYPGTISVLYLVVIRKKDAEIIYSRRYFTDKEWALQAEFLRQKKP